MDKKYRIIIGEDGDDFLFASDLTYEDALDKKRNLNSYIEEDN